MSSEVTTLIAACPHQSHLLQNNWNPFPPYKGEVGRETNFRPVSAATLLAEEPKPIPWIWEHFLPEGALVLLVSFMKVGKSTLAYPLAIAIAQGKPFLGYPTKQGGVLILAVEEHPGEAAVDGQRQLPADCPRQQTPLPCLELMAHLCQDEAASP